MINLDDHHCIDFLMSVLSRCFFILEMISNDL